jgi:hypothetical protein
MAGGAGCCRWLAAAEGCRWRRCLNKYGRRTRRLSFECRARNRNTPVPETPPAHRRLPTDAIATGTVTDRLKLCATSSPRRLRDDATDVGQRYRPIHSVTYRYTSTVMPVCGRWRYNNIVGRWHYNNTYFIKSNRPGTMSKICKKLKKLSHHGRKVPNG